MPIVSRALDYARLQANGRYRCRASGVDDKGRQWVEGPFWADSIVQAETRRDAAFASEQLQDAEERDLIEWVKAGNDPLAYDNVEMDNTERNRRLARKFAEEWYDLDPIYQCAISGWVAGFTVTQIANALAVSTAKAQKILDKATRQRDIICPAVILDKADVDG